MRIGVAGSLCPNCRNEICEICEFNGTCQDCFLDFGLVETAWAAGFFDGEGSVTYSETEGRTPRIYTQLAQVNPEPLQRFVDVVGGHINGPYDPKTENSRPYFKWSIENSDAVIRVFDKLGPFLSSEKKEAFEKAIAGYLLWLENPTCIKGHAMTKNEKGTWCSTCRSEAGKASAKVRWG